MSSGCQTFPLSAGPAQTQKFPSGKARFLRFSMGRCHYQHRDGRQPDDLFGHRTEEEMGQSGTAARGDHDKIHFLILDESKDFLDGLAEHDQGMD